MIALGNLLIAIGKLLQFVFYFFYWILIARCILSFVSPDPRNPIVQFITSTTEPVLAKVRGKIPYLGMMDLSPLVVIALIYFLDTFLVGSLVQYGVQFRGPEVLLAPPV